MVNYLYQKMRATCDAVKFDYIQRKSVTNSDKETKLGGKIKVKDW
jgi:hypothetical protein